MEWQVVRDELEAVGDLRPLEQVPPLHAVRSCRVLQQQRYPLSSGLVVDAVLVSVDRHVDVVTDRGAVPVGFA